MGVHIAPPPIEINASPAKVRETLLDFENLPSWHSKHLTSIQVAKPKDRKPLDLVKGDKLKIKLAMGMTFSPTIMENTQAKLWWVGSAPLLFTGHHCFEFQPSQVNPGGTRFVQYEDFSGLLAYTVDEKRKSGQDNMKGFIAVNEDLKRKCEASTMETN